MAMFILIRCTCPYLGTLAQMLLEVRTIAAANVQQAAGGMRGQVVAAVDLQQITTAPNTRDPRRAFPRVQRMQVVPANDVVCVVWIHSTAGLNIRSTADPTAIA